jgi:hypothetical protein
MLVATGGVVGLSQRVFYLDSRAIPGLLFFALWCGLGYLLTHRWKSVYLEGDVLRISNYLKKIRIPLDRR